MTASMPFWDLLHAAKYDMGPTALLPLRKKASLGFFRPKNPTASAGFKPANSGTRCQYATSRPPKSLLVPHGVTYSINKVNYSTYKRICRCMKQRFWCVRLSQYLLYCQSNAKLLNAAVSGYQSYQET